MKRILSLLLVLGTANLAFGQTWAESGDAPEGVPGHQQTIGVGPLNSITGSINRGTGDHVDTYCITVTNVQEFLASTKNFYGGNARTSTGANVDTRMWLWSTMGGMMLGNDDINTAALGSDTLASLISDPSTFVALSGGEIVAPTAAPIALVAGQQYLLSISTFPNDPDDAVGEELADLDGDFDALHGPNPLAGAFSAWENAASSTAFTYNIALRGATYCMVPEPASLALLAIGGMALIRRRR